MFGSFRAWLRTLGHRSTRRTRRAFGPRRPRVSLRNLKMESLEDRTVPAFSYTTAGSVYSQNFDGLPNAGTFALGGAVNTPIALDTAPISATGMGTGDWWLVSTTGTPLFNVDTGSSATGSVYSYGAAAATDRALGLLASGTTISRVGMELVNNTGATLTNFTVNFTAEQWRHGNNNTTIANSALNTMAFSYALGGTNINTGTFTAAPILDAVGVNALVPDSAVDGNSAAGRVLRSASVTGITWSNGQKLVLRWTDANDANNDDGVALDNFSFRAGANQQAAVGGDSITAKLAAAGTDGIVTVAAGTYAESVTLTGNQQLIFSGAVTLNSLSGGSTNAIILNSGSVLTVGDAGNTTYAGVIGGTGALVKQGTGKFSITGDYQLNTLLNAGGKAVNVTAGTLEIGRINILVGGIMNIDGGASVQANGTVNLMSNPTTTYTAITGGGTLKLSSVTGSTTNPDIFFGPNHRTNSNYGMAVGTAVDTGTISRFIAGRSGNNGFGRYWLSVGAQGLDTNFTGPISGGGGLTLIGQQINNNLDPVPFAISATSTFTGPVVVTWGSLYQNADGILNGNELSFNPVTGNSARLFLWGHNANVSNLSSSGAGTPGIANGVRVSGGASVSLNAATLTVNQTADTTYGGILADFIAERDNTSTGASTGALSLTIGGTKTLTLTGANTYTGSTTVNAGATLNGTGTSTTSFVTLDGTLSGTFNLGVAPVIGSPTASVVVAGAGATGFLKTGTLTLPAGATFKVDIAGTTVGTLYDQLQVTGDVDITGATLTVNPTFAAAANDTFVILNNLGGLPITGEFAGAAEGGTVSFGGQNFTITYLGGDGNDVALIRQAPPVRYVDDAWAAFTNGQFIQDADPVAVGDQNANFNVTAFSSVNAAIASVPALGTVIVNAGTYSEAVLVTKQITLRFQEADIAVGSLDDSVTNAAMSIDGIALTAGSNGGSTQVDSVIGGTGSLVKVGGGTMTFSGVNSYSGTTQVSGGALRAGSATAFSGTALMIVDAGAAFQTGGQSVTLPGLSAAAGSFIENAAATPGTLIIGAGSSLPNLFRDGTGGGALNVTFSGAVGYTLTNPANTYTGITTIAAPVSVDTLANGGVNSNIGASTSAAANLVLQGGGILDYTGGSLTLDRDFSLGTGGGTLSVSNAATTLTMSGSVTGPGNAFIKDGPGTLTFTSDTAFGSANSATVYGSISTGNISVNAGEMRTGPIRLSGGLRPGGVRGLTIAGGATFTSFGTIAMDGNGSIYYTAIDGSGTLKLRNAASSTANPSLAQDYGPNGADGGPFGVVINATVDVGTTNTHFIVGKPNRNDVSRYAGDFRLDGPLTGSAAIQFVGTATNNARETQNVLRADNSAFTGAVFIANSALTLSGPNTLSAANAVTFNSVVDAKTTNRAALQLYGHSVTIGSLNDVSAVGTTSFIRNGATVAFNGGTNSVGSAGTFGVALGQDSDSVLTIVQSTPGSFPGFISDGPNDNFGTANNGTGSVTSYHTLSIVKQGAATLTFGSSNIYTGSTTVSGGVLAAPAIPNAGRTVTLTTTAGSATATVDDATGLAIGQVVLASSVPQTGITITNIAGTTITLSSGTGVLAGTVTAIIGTPGSLGVSTPLADKVVLNGGTLRYTGSGQSTNRDFTLTENGGTLDASGSGAINWTSTIPVLMSGTGTRTLTLTGTNSGLNRLNAAVTDNGADAVTFVKQGTGAWYYDGFSSHTGGTSATAGRFGGNGTLGALAIANAELAPGDSPGILNTGNLSFTGSSTYTVEILGTIAGTTYDQTVVTGTVSLGNATLNLLPGFSAAIGDKFLIIDNDGTGDAVSGTFNGIAQGKTIFVSGQLFSVSYTGGDGNDVELTRITPPVVYVDDAWAGFTNGQPIADADPVAAGAQAATFGTNAFATPNSALAAITSAGSTIIVNAGTYNQAVVVNKTITLFLQEGPSTFTSLDDTVATATIELNGVSLTAGDAANTQIDSPIVGSGGLVKQGAGTMTLAGANSYSGTTQVSGGVLKAASASAFGATSGMTVDGGATLRLNGFAATIPTLTGTGTVENAAAAPATLTLTGAGTIAALLQDGGAGALNVAYAGGNFTPANTANSYTGGTTVSSGKLSLISIADSGSNSVIGAGAALTIAGGATLEYAGATTSTTRGFSLGTGGGTFAVTAAGNTLTLGGNIANATNSLTLDGNGNSVFTGVFTGTSGTLIKNGDGTATFTSDLAFGTLNDQTQYGSIATGSITVNAGTLQTDDIRLNISRPGTARNISIAAGAFFASTGTIAIDPSFSVYSDQIAGPGTLQLRKTGSTAADPSMAWDYGPNGGDANPWGSFLSAPIDLGNTGTHVIVGKTSRNDAGRYAGDLRFDGALTGSAGLQFTGLNNNGGHNMHFALRAANPAFTGAVGIANSDLILADNAALSSANAVTFNSINDGATTNRAVLFLYGHDVTIGSLNDTSDPATTSQIRNGSRNGLPGGGTNGNGNAATLGVFLGDDDDSTLTVVQSTNGVFNGAFADGPNDTAGGTAGTYRNLSLVKQGTGTLTLTGASTHTGGSQLNAGVTLVDNTTGSGLGAGAVVVDAAATLGGKGSFTGAAAVSGKLAPGDSPGILATGALSLTGTLVVELNGTTAGTGYDQAKVVGTVDLTGSSLSATAAAIPGGSKLTIIDNDDVDPVTGTFTGLAEGGAVTISGQGFTISYIGGDGNDVVLTRDGAATPVVTGFTVNDGVSPEYAIQRSRLTNITVNFQNPVAAAQFQTPGAVYLQRTALPGAPGDNFIVDVGNGLLITPATGNVSSLTLTFDNLINSGIESASLADGRWQLFVVPAAFSSTAGDIQLRRLFGDSNNDGTVDGAVDFPAFGAMFNASGPNLYFDFNNDGTVNGAVDFPAFGARFNLSL